MTLREQAERVAALLTIHGDNWHDYVSMSDVISVRYPAVDVAGFVVERHDDGRWRVAG